MGDKFKFMGMVVLAGMANAASKEPTLATLEKWARLMERKVPAFPTQLLSPVEGNGYCSREAVFDNNTQVPKFVNSFCPPFSFRYERMAYSAPFSYRHKHCYTSYKEIFLPESCDSIGSIDTSVRVMPEPFSLKEFDDWWLRENDLAEYRRNYLHWRRGSVFANYYYDTVRGSLDSVIYHAQDNSIMERDDYIRYKNNKGRDTLILKQETRYHNKKLESFIDSYRWISYDTLGRIRWQRNEKGNFPDPDLDDLYASVPDVEYFYDSKGRNHLRLHRYPFSQRLIALTSLRYDSLGRLDRQTVGYITKDSLIDWVFHLKWTYDSLGREKRVQEYSNRPRINAVSKSHYNLDYATPWWRW